MSRRAAGVFDEELGGKAHEILSKNHFQYRPILTVRRTPTGAKGGGGWGHKELEGHGVGHSRLTPEAADIIQRHKN
jgi:hypothetical protein